MILLFGAITITLGILWGLWNSSALTPSALIALGFATLVIGAALATVH